MADRAAGPSGEAAVVAVAESLVRWKRRVAPPGSLRARAVRAVAAPFLQRARTNRLRRSYLAVPEPRATVAIWNGSAPCGRVLPERPAILILKLDHIGDFVVALPALRALRDAFAPATITLVCGTWNVTLAERLGWFEHVIAFDAFAPLLRDVTPAGADRIARFTAMGLTGYDLAIDLRHEADTRPLLGLVGATYRAGFQTQAPIALDLAVPDCQDSAVATGAEPLHAEARLAALAAAVSSTFGRRTPRTALELLSRTPNQHPADPFIVLAPGAGSPIKRWPVKRLADIAKELGTRHIIDFVIVGGQADRDDGRILAASLPSERVRDLTGALPLARLPDLLIGASLFVGYDSGPTHLAASLGVPTVCVFSGVSDASVWQPLGACVTVVAGRTGCSPCRLVRAADCPNGVACLDVITEAIVLDACERQMAGVHANASSRRIEVP